MRRLPVRVGLLFTVILVAACAPGSAPGNTTERPPFSPTAAYEPAATSPAASGRDASVVVSSSDQVITISFAAPPEMQAVYEPLIATFQQDNPTIHVQLVDIETLIKPVVTDDGTFTTAEGSLREILSGADTAEVSPTPEAIAKGWVADLASFMDADPIFERADFYPGALDAYRRDGHTYLAPSFLWLDLLSYNKDLWASRGLPAPKPDWTWQDLKAAATHLVQRRGLALEVYGFLDWDGGYRALLAELAEAGVQIDPAAPVQLDRTEIVAALERAVELLKSGAIYQPSGQWGSSDEYRNVILSQRVALWSADILDDSSRPSFAVGAVPFPAASIGVGGYVMSGGTQHPQAAWRWLSFLSHQVIQWPFGGPGPVPARRSVAERSKYWERLNPETAAAFRAAIGRPSAPLLPEFDSRSFVLLRRAIGEVARGQKTAARALRDAQAALDAQLAQTPPEPTPATDRIAVEPPLIAPSGATTIMFAAPGGGQDPLDKVARAFNERNTGVFVKIRHINLNGGRHQLAQLAAESDCFVGNGSPEPGETNALLDLQPLIDADPTFRGDDYPRVLLAPFQSAGKLYGLPYAVDFRVLHYNQTLFDASGIAHPTAAWALDDLAATAQRLTGGAENARQYGFASTVLQWRDVFFFLDRFGTSATRGSGDTTEPNFTDPNVAQAIRAYLDLLRSASPHRRLTGYIYGEVVDTNADALVVAGRVGMWFDFGAFGTNARRYDRFTHVIAPPPGGKRLLTANDFRESGLYISARTQNADACWAWLKVLADDITALQGAFPARISLAASEAFIAHAPPGTAEVYNAYRQAFERTIEPASAVVPATQLPIDYYWFFRAVDRALQGKDLERELADAQAITEQFLACTRAGAAGNECAKQVDLGYQGWNSR